MADLIKCPNCGENNLADQEFCQYCQSRLQSLTGEDQPLTPGQAPTKKSTAEIESQLPQWLKEARESARQFSEEDSIQAPQIPQETPPTFSRADLLAGLQSQAEDDEEEIPDWLANLTGEKPKPTKTQDESVSESEPDVPSWLSGMAPARPQPGEKDELTDWMRSADASQESAQPAQSFSLDETPAGETQDWLRSIVSDDDAAFNETAGAADEPFTPSDTPDWLRGLEAPADAEDSAALPVFSDTPDWLKAMEADHAAPASESQPESSDTPDWLKNMEGESGEAPSSGSDMPDWLRAMDEQGKTQSADSAVFAGTGLGESESAPAPAEGEPDWLKSLESSASASDQDWLKSFQSDEAEQPASLEEPAQEQTPELDIPSWLKAAAPQSSIFDETPAGKEEPVTPEAFETPDWLKSFQPVDTSEAQTVPAISEPEPSSSVSAPVSDAQPGAEADSLFTEMPDWLSIPDESVAPESMTEPSASADAIAPSDLPSWVQAMRPVDSAQSSALLSDDKTLEMHGALAGLQGVLPAATGLLPSRKPKTLSIKLQASEEQLQHAGLLEQILSAETEPVPIESTFTPGRTSRGLRWLLAVLLFATLTAVLFMRTPIFPLPAGFPVEAVSAWNIVKDAVPMDGRVLVVFDYEPARAGEIEAAALPLFDQMILRHYPRLTFISTNETGLILAERFISSGPLAKINYQTGSQYLNLGYLPGGGMGIRAFVENPFATIQYAAPQTKDLLNFTPELAKAFPPVEGVDSFPQFSALFLLTDDADSARAWIEQTKSVRGDNPMPFVVVSSAQAAPMLQPYYASGQINGLVSGLHGGALFEQNDLDQNGQKLSNTVRAYWDAYNVGMLLAMALILIGGLVSLALGLRDRVAAREAK